MADARADRRVAPTAAKKDKAPYPFAEGDVVTLQSGGFFMTVQRCGRIVDTDDFNVYVIWATAGWKASDAFQERTFPHRWLKKVDDRIRLRPMIDDVDMPF